MTEGKKEPFNAKTLKTVLEKEIEARSAKYYSDQGLATHQQGGILSIAKYINAQEIENMLERIISQLGGGSLEQGMVFVSVKDKNGRFVMPDSLCDKIIVSVAYGQELVINNREYPPEEKGARTTESPSEAIQPEAMPEKASKPVVGSDGKKENKAGLNEDHARARQIQLVKGLKRRLDELWINRKGLGVDFNNPRALKIELVQDSSRITKIVQGIENEKLGIRIDQEAGLINVYAGGEICLKWKFPKDEM